MVAQSPEPGAHVLNARAFRIELEFRNVGFCGEGKTGVPGEKPLGPENNNKMMALSCLNYYTSIGSEVVIILIVVVQIGEVVTSRCHGSKICGCQKTENVS